MAINYEQLARKSLEDFRENWILLNPILIMLGLIFLLGIVAFIEIGVIVIVSSTFGLSADQVATNPGLMATAVIFIVMDIVALIGFIAYVFAMQFGMCYEVVEKGRTSNKTMMDAGKENWLLFFKYFMFMGVFVVLLNILLSFLNTSFGTMPVYYISLAIGIIALMLLGIVLVFMPPMLSRKKVSFFSHLGQSIHNTKNSFNHHFTAWLIIMLMNFAVMLIFYIIAVLAYMAGIWMIPVVASVLFIIMFAVYLVFMTWMNLFIVHVYDRASIEMGRKKGRK